MSEPIPDVPVDRGRKNILEVASLVWLVPLGALIIAVAVAWNNFIERGPLIEIRFEAASGIIADETELKYRDVNVGVVEEIGFSAALEEVVIGVRLDKDVAPFVDEDAQFWVVSPEVTTSGVTGLDTVLSGVYIQGSWDAEPGGLASEFEGLAKAPLLTDGEQGLQFELRTSGEGGLTQNTPIVYKGIEVGRIGSANISRDGRWVFADAVIYEPHDRLITTETRFWDASGFSFNVGPSGAQLDFSSVASLISGGITFETLVSGGEAVGQSAVFEVYPNEATARRSVFEDTDALDLRVQAIFSENISGLTAGAAVEWRGLNVGEVANVTGIVDPERFGDRRARLIATLDLRTSRFGLDDDASVDAALQFLESEVAEGLRARLASASLLTGGLKVELAMIEDAEPATLEIDGAALPTLPVAASQISDVRASATGVIERINALPIEELLGNAIDFLDSAAAFVSSEDIRQMPVELRELLADARGVIGSEAIQALPGALSAVLEDLQAGVTDLRTVLQSVADQNGIERLLVAVDEAGQAAAAVQSAATGLPELVERLDAVASKAQELPLERTLTETSDLISSVRAIVEQGETQALPGQLAETLQGLNAVLADLESEGAAERLAAALSSAEEAARAVESSTVGVPELIDQLQRVAAQVERLPLEDTLGEATSLIGSVRTIVEQSDTQALPGRLAATLEGLNAILDDLESEDAAARLTAALASAEEAARSVANSTSGVPELVERLQGVASRVEELPLEDVARELSQVLDTADTLFADARESELPAALSGALRELDAALTEIREGGLIASANQTLDATERAANSVASAADELPAIVERIDRLLSSASTTLSAYSDNSDFNRATLSALRDVQRAADAVASLARALERQPNSIILGR